MIPTKLNIPGILTGDYSACPGCEGMTHSHASHVDLKKSEVTKYFKCAPCNTEWETARSDMD